MAENLLKPIKLGQYEIKNNLFVAPMAGVTDRPFRSLCKKLGAGYAVSEMVTSRPDLYQSFKTSCRTDHSGEEGLIAVQIAGTDADMMAQAALYNIERGAQVIDINMGCPAKKVCNKWAGSALMQNERLAGEIIESVVKVCHPQNVPVTLKMRTGWSFENKNALKLAHVAQNAGVAMLTIHGRTREQRYSGCAEYDTIACVKQSVRIPVVANGDIDSADKAKFVLQYTQADALMIGRAAQGRPWIFQQIAYFLRNSEYLAPVPIGEICALVLEHLQNHYTLYGEFVGVRSARKHIKWYLKSLQSERIKDFFKQINSIDNTFEQYKVVKEIFDEISDTLGFFPD